jgi:hypothetical protein
MPFRRERRFGARGPCGWANSVTRLRQAPGRQVPGRSVDHSRNRTLNGELWTSRWPLYSMKPRFLNLFTKILTRGRVVPMISASVSWLIRVVIGCGPPSLPIFASRRRARASRFSLELKSWSTRSSSTRQKMRHEQLGEARLGVKNAQHLGLADPDDLAFGHGPGRCQAQGLADQASFAEELAGAHDPDHRFLALRGRDHDLDLALLDVEYRVRGSRLLEDHFVPAQVGHGMPWTDGCEKGFWIEGGLGFSGHGCRKISMQAGTLRLRPLSVRQERPRQTVIAIPRTGHC